MKYFPKRHCRFLVCGLPLFLCAGCFSIAEKVGQTLDGSAFAEKTAAIYRTEEKKGGADMEIKKVHNKAGEHSVIITLNQFPAIKIRGSAPNDRGEFQVTSLDYLGGSAHGWNEYRLELFGTGSLIPDQDSVILSVPQKIETVQISSGRIRSYDVRITGAEAAAKLNNRQKRITALAGWMKQYENAPKGLVRAEFEKYWKPILFPEMVSKKKQPAFWQQETDQWIRAEDVRWNTTYTERVFPEHLRELRNSGTMLHDWEEALDWIYIEYEWEQILGQLAQQTTLQKVKK